MLMDPVASHLISHIPTISFVGDPIEEFESDY